MKDFTYKSL